MLMFKITSNLSAVITYASTSAYLAEALGAIARAAHPNHPVTIKVERIEFKEGS